MRFRFSRPFNVTQNLTTLKGMKTLLRRELNLLSPVSTCGRRTVSLEVYVYKACVGTLKV